MEKNEEKEFLGSRIRRYRKENKLTGQQFAEIIGISQGNVSDIERGRVNPSLETIIKIVEKTGMNIEYLVFGTKAREVSRLSVTPKTDLPAFIDELLAWATEFSGSGTLEWLENHLETCLPAFKIWREQKKEATAFREDQVGKKVA